MHLSLRAACNILIRQSVQTRGVEMVRPPGFEFPDYSVESNLPGHQRSASHALCIWQAEIIDQARPRPHSLVAKDRARFKDCRKNRTRRARQRRRVARSEKQFYGLNTEPSMKTSRCR